MVEISAAALEVAKLIVRLLGFSAGVGGVFYGGVFLNYVTHDHREAVEWGFLAMGTSFIFIFNNALLSSSVLSTFFMALGICLTVVTASVSGTILWYESQAPGEDPGAYVGVDEAPLNSPAAESNSDEEPLDE